MKKSVHLLMILASLLFVYAATDVADYIRIYFNGKANQVQIIAGPVDPSTVGVSAPVGSLYLRSNGTSYKKTGATNTDWKSLPNHAVTSNGELLADPSFEYEHPADTCSSCSAYISPSPFPSVNNTRAMQIEIAASSTGTYSMVVGGNSLTASRGFSHSGKLSIPNDVSCKVIASKNGVDEEEKLLVTSGNKEYNYNFFPFDTNISIVMFRCTNTALIGQSVYVDLTQNHAFSVDSYLADIKRTQSETLLNVGNLTASTNLASFTVENDSLVRGIYTKSAAGLTFHQDAQVVIVGYIAKDSTATSNIFGDIYLNGVSLGYVTIPSSSSSIRQSLPVTSYVKAGDKITFAFNNGTGAGNRIQISATATSPTIVMQNETFNSDLHLGAWVAQPNTATCSSAVIEGEENVGKWTTCNYVAVGNNNTNGCTSRPTQSDAEARVQGVRAYTRPKNTTSTCGSPTMGWMNIGKNYKGFNYNLFNNTSRSADAEKGYVLQADGVTAKGMRFMNYNPTTGIVFFDGGFHESATTTSVLDYPSVGTQNNGYLVINASKNPVMSGVNVERIFFRASQSITQSLSASTLPNILNVTTATDDTCGCLGSGGFIAPSSGIYGVDVSWNINAARSNTTADTQAAIMVNGGTRSLGQRIDVLRQYNQYTATSFILLNKGDLVQVGAYPYNTAVASIAITRSLTVTKVGH